MWALAEQIQFGAALHQERELLADALLESYVFSGKFGVSSLMTKVLGVPTDNLTDLLSEYERICHLRHCCTHRFGKLGFKNCLALGVEKHKDHLDKSLTIGKDDLERVAAWLNNFVKGVNNFLFGAILLASLDEKSPAHIQWTWDFRKDRVYFTPIYRCFALTVESPASPTAIELYNRFREAYKTGNLGKNRKKQKQKVKS